MEYLPSSIFLRGKCQVLNIYCKQYKFQYFTVGWFNENKPLLHLLCSNNFCSKTFSLGKAVESDPWILNVKIICFFKCR